MEIVFHVGSFCYLRNKVVKFPLWAWQNQTSGKRSCTHILKFLYMYFSEFCEIRYIHMKLGFTYFGCTIELLSWTF